LTERKITIITGTPGTGKTTLAARLAVTLSISHVDLPPLVEAEGLHLGIDDRGSRIVDLRKVRRRLRQLSRSSLGLVVSSHVPDVAYRSDVKAVVVLRLHPCELKKRLESLKWPASKVKENVAAEALATCLKEALMYYGEGLVRELDVTGLGVEEAVASIAKLVEGSRQSDRVDWLSRALEDEELAKLLAWL